MAATQLQLIAPGDSRYPALAMVAARHNMTPDEWQRRAHEMDEAGRRRRNIARTMRQVPRYREEVA